MYKTHWPAKRRAFLLRGVWMPTRTSCCTRAWKRTTSFKYFPHPPGLHNLVHTHIVEKSHSWTVWHKRFWGLYAHSHGYSPDVQRVNQEDTQCLKFTVIMDCPNYFCSLEFCLNKDKLKSIKHKWRFLDFIKKKPKANIRHASYILHHTL